MVYNITITIILHLTPSCSAQHIYDVVFVHIHTENGHIFIIVYTFEIFALKFSTMSDFQPLVTIWWLKRIVIIMSSICQHLGYCGTITGEEGKLNSPNLMC